MILYRILSFFCYLGLTVFCLFSSSHPISHRRCAAGVRPLPGLSGLAHIVRPVRKYHTLLVSLLLPASLHHHHVRLLLYRVLLAFDFGRSSTFRLKCDGGFRPIWRTCHQDFVDKVFLG